MKNMIPQVMCAKCGKLVDTISQWQDPLSFDFVVQVECHGEIERVKISQKLLRTMMKGGLRGGVAFNQRKLEGATTS